MIGNKDVEYKVFLTLSVNDIGPLIKVNRYIKTIIMTDDFWRPYLILKYNVNYVTESMHIGHQLLKNQLNYDLFFNQSIINNDIAVVKFLLDTHMVEVNPAHFISTVESYKGGKRMNKGEYTHASITYSAY